MWEKWDARERGRLCMCKQTVFCSVCVFVGGVSLGAATELVSPQLHVLSLKAHLTRSVFAVGPGRDYSQRVPGPVGALPDWQRWHREWEPSQVLRACEAELLLGLSGF